MSQQRDMAHEAYGRLDSGPVSVASLVHELRSRWGAGHGVGEVHLFVTEVMACLLRYGNVEVGEMTPSGPASWQLPSWEANEKIEAWLMARNQFLEDEAACVFWKKRQV